MKKIIIGKLVGLVVGMLGPDQLKEFADMALDFVEEKVLGTASTVDDSVVIPICDMIRKAFDIPDND